MKKLKIAVLIDWYLPGTKAGGPVRSVYSILNLLKREYEFYVITLNKDLGSNSPYGDIIPNRFFKRDEVGYYYFSENNLNIKNLLDILDEVNPDLVYVNSFWSFPFSIQVVRAWHSGTLNSPVLLAPRGMLGRGALGLKSFKKKVFLLAAKLSGWYKNVNFHATQQQEEKDILKVFPSARIVTAPNINATAVTKNISVKSPGGLKLFFLSRISVVKNLHFALEVLKHTPSDIKITYDIYGNAEDPEYLEKCIQIMNSLPGNVSVTLKGEIAFDKVPEVLKNYNALFLPTLNENYGHSIVESLLCGCPVIISDQTPWLGLVNENAGFDLPLSDPKLFAEAIATLADDDQEQFNNRSEAAINYISGKIDLQGTEKLYKKLFNGSARH